MMKTSNKVTLITDHPIASQSADHLHPRGTMLDNTHCLPFVEACKRRVDEPSLLDLGCAGGGLVRDFLDVGFEAVGLEGSDYSQVNERAEWPMLPERLFTCDITKPFQLRKGSKKGSKMLFDFVTAWEVLEHIEIHDLGGLFDNVKRHMKPGGYFMASIATFPDGPWHVTLRPKEHWLQWLKEHGFKLVDGLAEKEWPRGSANGPGDWSGKENGFHVACKIA